MSTQEPPTVIHSKAKKPLVLRKHPPYLEMVGDALVTLKQSNGSSMHAIRKFIEEKHKNQLRVNFKKMLLIQLKKLVASDKLVKVKASYKLPSTAKPMPKEAAKPKGPAAKRKPEAKKKAAAKRKPAAKAKLAPKAKPATKTVTKKPPAKKKLAAKPKAKAGSAKAAAKPNPAPKAMPAANSSNKPARQRKRSTVGLITVEEISRHYGKSFEEAANILGVRRSKLKRICTSLGIKAWPYTPNISDSHSSNFRGSNELNPATHTQHAMYSSTRAETILIDELGQPKTTLKSSVKPLTIKATYKDDTVRFPFILSDGFTELEELIATRFRLKLGSFSLQYEDEDGDIILITCDSGLDVSADDFRQPDGHTVIRLMVCPLVN